MLDFTPIARKWLEPKAAAAREAAANVESSQRATLGMLLKRLAGTVWGKEHGILQNMTYEEFAKATPVVDYEALRPYAMRMVDGEADVLWPGKCSRFAQSSGTSGGKSKFVPVTHDSLKHNHYPGATLAVALYLSRYPQSAFFSGKGFILGGSFANELAYSSDAKVGDLSANLIDDINPIINMLRVPPKKVALMEDWREKLPALIDHSIAENITNISGVPSWFLTVLKGALEKTKKTKAQDIWPHLEVFFHGGISFKPYRNEYAKIMSSDMRYWATYNASEGFFAAQSEIGEDSMLLLVNNGVFYEFAPLGPKGPDYDHTIPPWHVKPGKVYAMVITSCNGLCRYAIGDTVRIEHTNPIKISIAGRTKSYINAFGEELMECNAEAAIEKTCALLDCAVQNYHVAPIYAEGKKKGRHQWLIEWNREPANIKEFAVQLDQHLQQENSDYQAKRQGGIFLDNLEVITAPKGLFEKWLQSTGKLGGQRKVPRLANSRDVIDNLLKIKIR